jgi:hypothetical protein
MKDSRRPPNDLMAERFRLLRTMRLPRALFEHLANNQVEAALPETPGVIKFNFGIKSILSSNYIQPHE